MYKQYKINAKKEKRNYSRGRVCPNNSLLHLADRTCSCECVHSVHTLGVRVQANESEQVSCCR